MSRYPTAEQIIKRGNCTAVVTMIDTDQYIARVHIHFDGKQITRYATTPVTLKRIEMWVNEQMEDLEGLDEIN
jgi:hypothetical protein